MAQDSQLYVSARLALSDMLPNVAARFARLTSSSPTVRPDHPSTRSTRPSIAHDSAIDDGGRLSLEKLFPKIVERLNV